MLEKILLTVFGAAIGWFLSWHRLRIAENANLISDHIKDIERFSEELLLHWTTSFIDGDAPTQKQQIAKIKSLHMSISSFYGEAERRLAQERLVNYYNLQGQLFDIGLGSKFETIGRDYCEETAIETQSICWELIQNLRAARREQYGIFAIFRALLSRLRDCWFRL